jgi:hypothetical protein
MEVFLQGVPTAFYILLMGPAVPAEKTRPAAAGSQPCEGQQQRPSAPRESHWQRAKKEKQRGGATERGGLIRSIILGNIYIFGIVINP